MIDSISIRAVGGNGGDGCISFRRQKFVPKGGPDGGDGGKGGDVVIVGDDSYSTLLHLKGRKLYRAGRGGHGSGRNRTGRNGEDLEVRVPVGTEVWRREEDGEWRLLADLGEGDRIVVARGGGGGKGNLRFVSPTNQEPLLAEKGERGEDVEIRLDMKLLADVGIIGKPNAGKSTLLAACSRAHPKIADYPFTTTEPVLGVVETRDRQFTLVEIPGLIEGAHEGVGLGIRFLRHAERTRVVVHLLDGLSQDPYRDYQEIHEEVRQYQPAMAERPQVIAVNKVDITEVRERVEEIRASLERVGRPVFFISAARGEGVHELLGTLLHMLESAPRPRREGIVASPRRRVRDRVRVERRDGQFIVESARALRIVERVDMDDYRVRLQLLREFRRLGVARALEAAGIKQGDVIRVGDKELRW